MSAWQKVTLSSAQVQQGLVGRIQYDCTKSWIAAQAPVQAAVFSRAERVKIGDQREQVSVLYFTPDMVPIVSAIVATYNPQACEAPPRNRTTPLIMNEQSGFDPRSLLA